MDVVLILDPPNKRVNHVQEMERGICNHCRVVTDDEGDSTHDACLDDVRVALRSQRQHKAQRVAQRRVRELR